MKEGYVYALTSPIYKNKLFKIGHTTKTVEERLKQINSATGVVVPFDIAYRIKVSDSRLVESIVHEKLREFRYNKNREFFACDLQHAIETIKGVAKDYGTENGVEAKIVKPKQLKPEINKPKPYVYKSNSYTSNDLITKVWKIISGIFRFGIFVTDKVLAAIISLIVPVVVIYIIVKVFAGV